MATTTNVRAMVHRGIWSSMAAAETAFGIRDGSTTIQDGGYRMGNVVTYDNSQWMCIVARASNMEPGATGNTDWVRVDGSGGGSTTPTTFTMSFNDTTRELTAIVDGITQTVTIPGGSGGTPTTPTSFVGAISGQLEGAQSYIGSAFPSRTVTVSSTRGALAASDPFTVIGVTASNPTATTFNYTPSTTIDAESWSVVIRGTGTDAGNTAGMTTINVNQTYYYPFYFGTASSAPTSTAVFGNTGTSSAAWATGQTFSVTGGTNDRVYVAVRTTDASSPRLLLNGFESTPDGMTTFNAGTRAGGTEGYTVYDFGPIEDGATLNYTVNTV